MKNFYGKTMMACSDLILKAAAIAKEHKKAISFAYLVSILTGCFGSIAFAADISDYPLWATTKAVLDFIFPVFIVVGIVLVLVGIAMILVSRFNEQSITGPLIILVVGATLILIRVVFGSTISKIALEQLYPELKGDTATLNDLLK